MQLYYLDHAGCVCPVGTVRQKVFIFRQLAEDKYQACYQSCKLSPDGEWDWALPTTDYTNANTQEDWASLAADNPPDEEDISEINDPDLVGSYWILDPPNPHQHKFEEAYFLQ